LLGNNKYRVDAPLGEGGMACIYRAVHVDLCLPVAVKVLRDVGKPEVVARFVREARATARLRSEHAARVLDVGVAPGGAPFLVMEHLEGASLDEVLCARGPLPVPEVVELTLQACDALAEAHALGIVHRDIKPANLFVTRRHDGAPLLKVLDFGVAKVTAPLAPAPAAELTTMTSLVGSLGYMAPEQIERPLDVDARADLWSLGVVLFELLTGSMPFPGDDLGAVVWAMARAPAPWLRDCRPDVPAGLAMLVARCLQRELAARPADVAAVASALAPFASVEGRVLATRIGRTLRVTSGARGALGGERASGVVPSSEPAGDVARVPGLRAIARAG